MDFRVINTIKRLIENINNANTSQCSTGKILADNTGYEPVNPPQPLTSDRYNKLLDLQDDNTVPISQEYINSITPEVEHNGGYEIHIDDGITSLCDTLNELMDKEPTNIEEPIPDAEYIEPVDIEESLSKMGLSKDEIRIIENNKSMRKLVLEMLDWDKIDPEDNIPTENVLSIGNSKIGKNTLVFNLTPAIYCPSLKLDAEGNQYCQVTIGKGETSKISCYAYQDELQYPEALILRIRQMKFWQLSDTQTIVNEFRRYIKEKKLDKIAEKTSINMRWNQSGDIDNKEDVDKMIQVAKMMQEEFNIHTYTYTARYDLINHFKTPDNVRGENQFYVDINASGTDFEGTNGFQFSAFPDAPLEYFTKNKFGVLKYDETKKPTNDKITYYNELVGIKDDPDGWFFCPVNCGPCDACKHVDGKVLKKKAIRIHRAYSKRNFEVEDIDKIADTYKVREDILKFREMYKYIESTIFRLKTIFGGEWKKEKTISTKALEIKELINNKFGEIEDFGRTSADMIDEAKKRIDNIKHYMTLKSKKKNINKYKKQLANNREIVRLLNSFTDLNAIFEKIIEKYLNKFII